MTLLRDGMKVGAATYVAKKYIDHRDKKYEVKEVKEVREVQPESQSSNSNATQQGQVQGFQQSSSNSGSAQEYYQNSGRES